MNTALLARLGGLVVLTGVLGSAAVVSAPSGTHIGHMWPVGLASGVFLSAPRARSVAIAGVLLVVVCGSFLVGGYDASVALPYAVVVVLAAATVDRLVPRQEGGRPWLLRQREFIRYTGACAAGAAVGGSGFALVSALADFGVPWQVGLAAAATQLASQLILVPLFLRVPSMVLPQSRQEPALRWLVVGCVTAAPFLSELPSLIFLVLPALAWSAARAPMREIQWQVLTVAVITSLTTDLDFGPFPGLNTRGAVPTELLGLPQQAFLVSCALVCVPFAMAVRQQRESAREAAEEKSRSERLINSAQGLAIVGTDDLGRINLFNPGAERILGYAPAEVQGRSPEMFHTDEEIARLAGLLRCKPDFFSVVASMLEREARTPMDWEFVRKDGERRTLAFLLNPVRSEDGSVIGFIATADDVTERIRAQRAVEASLEKALDAERAAVQRLQEVDRAKDTFVSTISHELRTPITNIVGYLEMLQDGMYGEVSAAQHEALDRVSGNSRRLLGLIGDLLTLSRIEHTVDREAHRPVDLREVVDRVAQLAVPAADTEDVKVVLTLPSGPARILGDGAQLERLVSNLVGNAVKFTPPAGKVTIALEAEPTWCRLEVSDTGMGIPRDELPYVFDRFFRSSTALAQAVPGTGLGLAIAKSIADVHSARINVESSAGEGTTFWVEFRSLVEPGQA